MESDTFYGDVIGKISLEVVWDFHRENMVNQITRQLPYQFFQKNTIPKIKMLDNFGCLETRFELLYS